MEELLRTENQKKKDERDEAIWREYERLMAVPGQSSTEVGKMLMKKYGIKSLNTIYVIRKRYEKKIGEGLV